MLLNVFSKGVNQYLPAYAIQDDEFPNLINATVRRGVVSKKLGASFLGQLALTYASLNIGSTTVSGTFSGTISITPNSGFAPSSLSLVIGSITYTDNGSGLIVNSSITYGSFNYATGSISLTGVTPSTSIEVDVDYYPGYPVMGIGTFQSLTYAVEFFLIVLDTTYAYTFNYAARTFFSISTYNMTPPLGIPPNTVTWTGTSTQQFDFQNFQDCLFLTNNQIGMQFKNIATLTASGTTVTVGITAHGLVAGDQVFFYEVQGMTQINGLVGTVLSTGLTANSFQALVPALVAPSAYTSNGIVQYLTSNAANPSINGIRYYTTNGLGSGFVNFAPPLQPSSIVETGGTVFYLVGCKLMIQYGNRLLALNCTIQDSAGNQTSQPNTIYYSQINSALYTVDPTCWYNNPPGTGGFYTLSGNQNIVSVEISYEQLVIGLAFSYRKLITTGSTIQPFVDYIISDVYGSICPFASVLLDNAVLGITNVGITLATTNDVARIDAMTIPDTTQEISRANNGLLQVCAIRDYLQQLIYITYPETTYPFPNKTIVFNYIENNWSFYTGENTTSYGQYLEQSSSRTWRTVGTWADAGTWGDASGDNYTVQIASGTPTGAVTLKGNATYNEPSMLIQSVTLSGSNVILGIVNHNLTSGQYIFIQNALGMTNLNDFVFLVVQILSSSSILISPALEVTGTYLGLGTCSIMDNFLIQTKQFIPNWERGLGSELFSCRVLLAMTSSGQISGQVTTSFQPFSLGDLANDVIPTASIIFTTADTNLGLSGNEYAQSSAWHRLPVLSDGQTIQFNLFLSSSQMMNPDFCQSPVVLQGLLLDFKDKGQVLC